MQSFYTQKHEDSDYDEFNEAIDDHCDGRMFHKESVSKWPTNITSWLDGMSFTYADWIDVANNYIETEGDKEGYFDNMKVDAIICYYVVPQIWFLNNDAAIAFKLAHY